MIRCTERRLVVARPARSKVLHLRIGRAQPRATVALFLAGPLQVPEPPVSNVEVVRLLVDVLLAEVELVLRGVRTGWIPSLEAAKACS